MLGTWNLCRQHERSKMPMSSRLDRSILFHFDHSNQLPASILRKIRSQLRTGPFFHSNSTQISNSRSSRWTFPRVRSAQSGVRHFGDQRRAVVLPVQFELVEDRGERYLVECGTCRWWTMARGTRISLRKCGNVGTWWWRRKAIQRNVQLCGSSMVVGWQAGGSVCGWKSWIHWRTHFWSLRRLSER